MAREQRNVCLTSGIWVRCAFDRLVKPQELKPHPKNSNLHPPEQIKFFTEILRLQGFRRAATVSLRSGFITRGHGLVMAAFALGSEVPVEDQDYESEGIELLDVEADNELARRAIVDVKIKVANLEQIKLFGFDVQLAGIGEMDASKLIADFNATQSGQGGADGAPANTSEPITKKVEFECDANPDPDGESPSATTQQHCPRCGFVITG
jgi:hypothetical protein